MNNIKEIEYKDYFVYCNLNSEFEDNVTLVYFDHASGRNSNNESIDKNVAKNRVEKVIKSYSKLCKNLWCIVPKLCNWFQSAEIYIVLDAINSLRSRCVCFGFSMGGFGAINFSGYLNAEFVAFQPQYKLDDNVPMTPFYRSCYQNIIRFFSVSNIENNLCKNQKGLLFFDPYNEVDLYHAKEIYKKTNCNLIEIPYSGHATSTQVNRFCQIKNIIFDLGNVILQCSTIETMYNFTASKEMAEKLITYIFKSEEWKLLDLGNISKEEAILRIQERVADQYKPLIKEVMDNRAKYLKLNKDTIEIAKKLKDIGYKIYVLSNMSTFTYEYFKDNEFFKLCNGIVISAYEHIKKPDEEIFKRLLDRYKIVPEECLFIDDDDTGRSFETANALGINGRRVLPNDSEDVLKLLEEYNIKLQGKMEEI